MSADKQPDHAPDPLNRISAACHEPGDCAGIRPFEGHTIGGSVGWVDACNSWRWVLGVARPQDHGLMGLVGEVDLAGGSVCAAPHSGRDNRLVAFVGKDRSVGYTWTAENEAVHTSDPVSDVALSGLHELAAHGYSPNGSGSIWGLRPAHGVEKLHSLARWISGRQLHLLGFCWREQVHGLVAVC